MLNTITFTGNITRDVELRATKSGHKVCTIPLANNSYVNGKQTTEYFDFTYFLASVDQLKVLKKGNQITVEGRLRDNVYTDKDGKQQRRVELVASRFYLNHSKKASTPASSDEAILDVPEDVLDEAFAPVDPFVEA